MRELLRPAAFVLTLGAALALLACDRPAADDATTADPVSGGATPTYAEGFDLEGSDPKAIELADRAIEAMGGRRAWNDTQFITWRFFYPPPDGRLLVWDKKNGRVRIEHGDAVTLVDIDTREGRAFEAGVEITDPEALSAALQAGYETWVNDSYWLVMPYKLTDSGVTLKYLGEATTDAGSAADVVQLTFAGVGVTPQNKYHVWLGKESGLVEQWAFFAEAEHEEPAFTLPWNNWVRHGDILLSGDRGARQLTEIAVSQDLPDSVFNSPAPMTGSTAEEAQPAE